MTELLDKLDSTSIVDSSIRKVDSSPVYPASLSDEGPSVLTLNFK